MDMNMDLDLDLGMDVSRQKGQTFGTRTARDTFDVQCLSNWSDGDKMPGTFDYPTDINICNYSRKLLLRSKKINMIR